MNPTLKDFIWCIRLFPNNWGEKKYFVLENLFYYDCSNDENFLHGQMSACIPQKKIEASVEEIQYIHDNWKKLYRDNIPIMQYDNGFWKVDLKDVETY